MASGILSLFLPDESSCYGTATQNRVEYIRMSFCILVTDTEGLIRQYEVVFKSLLVSSLDA